MENEGSESGGQLGDNANSQNLNLSLGSVWTGKCEDFDWKIKDLSYADS